MGDAYYNRGNCHGHLKQYEKAIEDYSQSIRLDPDIAYAYNNRGFTYANLGQYEKAIEDFDRALSLNSELEDVYYNKACSCAHIGKTEEALNNLRQALQISPQKYCDLAGKDSAFEMIGGNADFQNLLKKYCDKC
jgi:tetratricopeptide (TPR) repeat protein